ncbi:MAG TPA: PDR/VanB family oxidoreductase [Solirubrobacterales bacterium]|nr:PDR/VanB family oxidoreductase [Solirubrobacterales bacterium]
MADGVLALTLVDPAGGPLPAWKPGAHVDLALRPGLVRQYSLCGDPDDHTCYRIAVLLEPDGRGGSRYVHEEMAVGSEVEVAGPRNHFELIPAPGYVFVAGGIGITPLLPMMRAVAAAGLPWQLHYGGRSRSSMAFADEIAGLGGAVRLVPEDERGRLDVVGLAAAVPAGAVVFCCGPEGLIEAMTAVCEGRGIDLRVERFAPRPDAPADVGGDRPVTVECRRSGVTVEVAADESILDALRAANVQIFGSCHEGTCGTCECEVLEGEPDHRDSLLTEAERQEGELMFPCVSRALTDRLVLDV